MDLLYSKYASPMELMNIYFEQGRLGEFVENILEAENKRKQEENDNKLWIAYVHSMTDASFNDWKAKLMKGSDKPKGRDEDMTEADMEGIINNLFHRK